MRTSSIRNNDGDGGGGGGGDGSDGGDVGGACTRLQKKGLMGWRFEEYSNWHNMAFSSA